MGGINDTYELCSDFLAAAELALSLTDAGTPERAYVSPGAPAFDCCPQLTVHGFQLSEDATTPQGGPLGYAKRVVTTGALLYAVVVTVIRCIPTIGGDAQNPVLPDPNALEAAGQAVNQDVWALWNHLSKEIRDGRLSERCKGAYRDGATAIAPQGGCAGWALQWRVPINGADLGDPASV